ncbi:MAG: single-stranded-DNA-specific exonuclease RecJ [Bacteroidales bacterium]|jgi:single-stranded-DNA-specific exonuclease|nr:single-stranded-DNA-specific exonuclease RecJ [Bacteroidales bacterium]
MQKKWVLQTRANDNLIKYISGLLNIPLPLANLLAQRNVKTYNEARSFFKPSLQDIHDPYLMKDMEKSVHRVEKAVADKEKILVFGDYDVDGTSAVALIYSFLKDYTSFIEYYVPDRYEEGYGISVQSIEYARENNFTLIIALDCGIKCHKEIDLANRYNIDVIVCDHHLPGDILPNAYAILDPKQSDCDYPYKELSGCGVGFKLVHAMAQKRNIPFTELGKYFDLLVISIASDIVPITGENRVFAYFGLKLINMKPRKGLESLLAFSKIVRKAYPTLPPHNSVFTKEITINDLVFYVGPRINAAGRMATGRSAVHLLITNTLERIAELGERVDTHNNERRELDIKTTNEAIDMVSTEVNLKKRSIIVYDPSWIKGVIGIVASRLVEHFYKPSIVFTLSNGLITGSARSVKDFDLYLALSQCNHLLEHFGGHTFAAGLSLKPENLDAFIEKFEQIVSENISEASTFPAIEIDEEVSLDEINPNFFNIMKRFSPFGPGNMYPVFMSKNVTDTGKARIVGQNHIKLTVFQADNRSYPVDAIAFGLSAYFERIHKGEPFHICYHIDMNEWQGKNYLQLVIKDVKFPDEEADILYPHH